MRLHRSSSACRFTNLPATWRCTNLWLRLCWLPGASILKRDRFHPRILPGRSVFSRLFTKLSQLAGSMIDSITRVFPPVSQVQSAFFQSDPSSPAILLGIHMAILSLCLLLNFQQPFENLEVNTPRVFMTIDRTGECTMRRICLPPFPVSCPGAIRYRTACFCYAFCVPMRLATRSGSSDSFPCPYRHCAGKMQGKISALATRALLHLCRRNSICMVTRLAVHFADEYKVECDESFHARLHRRLQRFRGTPFAPPHVVGLSAKG